MLFLSRNMNIYLYFPPILQTKMAQAIKILPFFKAKAYLVYIVNNIAVDDLVMQGARHQQPWYWPSIGNPLSLVRFEWNFIELNFKLLLVMDG